jgi:hypothetical protein
VNGTPEPWVQNIAKAIAYQVESQHGYSNRKSGEHRRVRRHPQEDARLAQHHAPKDSRGKDTASLPIMSGKKSLANCRLFLGFSSGVPGGREYVRQLGQYKVPLLVGCVTVSATEYEPYVQSGQMSGLIAGLKGAAEYEFLSKQPGAGLAGMDAQSAGHMLIIAFVLLCNVGLVAGQRRAKQ